MRKYFLIVKYLFNIFFYFSDKVRNHSCHLCDKSFLKAPHLRAHIQMHMGKWLISWVQNICFYLLSFSQNERKIYWFCSVSFAQFVYFLREVCLLFNFWMMKFTIMCFFWHSCMKFLNYGPLHAQFVYFLRELWFFDM